MATWLLIPALPLCAGSVFMKNGYVIQGKVVKHSPEEVVLAWPNGRVTLKARFIESVLLDAGDRVRTGAAGGPRPAEDAHLETRVEIVLPERLDSLLDEIAQRSRTAASGPAGGDAARGEEVASSAEPSSEVSPKMVEVPREEAPVEGEGTPWPEVLPVKEVGPADGSVAVRIPEDWTFEELRDGAWQITGPAQEEGRPRPRIACVVLDEPRLSLAEQVAVCRRAEGAFEGLRILREGRREIGLHLGFEAVGTAERRGTTYAVRRVLVPTAGRVYVIGCVAPAPVDRTVEAVFDLCIGDLRFRS